MVWLGKSRPGVLGFEACINQRDGRWPIKSKNLPNQTVCHCCGPSRKRGRGGQGGYRVPGTKLLVLCVKVVRDGNLNDEEEKESKLRAKEGRGRRINTFSRGPVHGCKHLKITIVVSLNR